MEIKFFCKSCGQKLAVDEQYAGMEAVCPQCNATILVPAVSEEVPESAAEADPDTMKTMRGNLPEDPDRTQVGRRSYGDVAGSGADDATMPGKRDRKPDGRFAVGDLIIGRYKVLAELGQGGMGVVYKCFDETAGIEVALKALPPELSHNMLEMEDIKENFQLIHNLHHPNIASSNTLEKDNANGNYYLIMECVEGEDLRRWIKRKRKEGALTLEMILPIIRQVGDALDYAHKEKIIHRDIKPGNIMIKPDGEVKVLDFGLAAQIHTSMTRVSMAYHGTSGTGPYMAPEQWQGRAQGAPADQYALAVMTYEMLAGHLPFEAQDPAVLREAVLNGTPAEIPDASPSIAVGLKKAMQKTPEQRFLSCMEFTEALMGRRRKRVRIEKISSIIIGLVLLGIILGISGFLWCYKKDIAEAIVQPMPDELQDDSDIQSLYLFHTQLSALKKKVESAGYDKNQSFGIHFEMLATNFTAGENALYRKEYSSARALLNSAKQEIDWIENNAALRAQCAQGIHSLNAARQATQNADAYLYDAEGFNKAKSEETAILRDYEAGSFSNLPQRIDALVRQYQSCAEFAQREARTQKTQREALSLLQQHLVEQEKKIVVSNYARGQTFGRHLDKLNTIWQDLRSALNRKDLKNAKVLYRQADEIVEWLEAKSVQRENVKKLWDQPESVKKLGKRMA